MRVSLRLLLIMVIGLTSVQILHAQTTGKIAGVVMDKQTGEPIVGANIFVEELSLGAASDENGDFYILNIPPGIYVLNVQMLGYSNYKISDLRISVNRTAFITAEMISTIIEGEEIIVQAEKIASKKDQTSSIRNVSSEQMEILPVENIQSVVNLQAGIVAGHFRGGRRDEVAFMIDGLQVVESFGGENNLADVETEVVEELEVITGTFNAEYGRAMSGVVNAVTKDGGDEFHGSVSAGYGNYYSAHGDVFPGLDNSSLDHRKDYKFQLSGPLWKKYLSFLLNVRVQDNNDYLNGIHRFNVDDYSDFSDSDPDLWYSEHTGGGEYVPMSYSKLNSLTAKLTSRLWTTVKLSFLYNRNDEEWKNYSHSFKYNPYGQGSNHRKADMYTLQFNHAVSNTVFYDVKFSYIDNYYGWYVYKNPADPRYVHDAYLNNNGPGFYTGGQQKTHETRTIEDYNAKFDITWQVNKSHMVKTGFLYTGHLIDHSWRSIQNGYAVREEDENIRYYDYVNDEMVFPYYEPVIYPDSSIYTDKYIVRPIEISGYIQDKMEFDRMVVNLGLRYDYFDPNTTYPSQRRNPANQLDFPDNPEKMSEPVKTSPQVQISPRLGLSYQLGDVAVLHFSYGHFFQMPAMYALYQNHSLLVAPTNYSTTMGNSQLKAQKTVQYEIGLWQELTPSMGLEVNVYYRDIYNLLSTKMINTYNQIIYGLYTNKDYGNVKGLELKYDFKWDALSVYLNYTLQYTRGNADNPQQTFNRAGDSRDPIPTLIPMSWDQRHTLNVTVAYHTKDLGVTMTGYYNSGTPFTWVPFDLNPLANINFYPNNSYQPSNYSVDVNGYFNLYRYQGMQVRLNYSVYNLFDRLNEAWVDATTGRAYTSIIRSSASHHSDFNEYIDTIHDPSMYSAPRLFKAGLSVSF
jgi:outer membrane receptor protein involved in Fe transport